MGARLRLLVVSPTFPWPLNSGGRIRLYHVLKALSARYSVRLLTLADNEVSDDEARRRLGFVDHIVRVPIRQRRIDQLLRLLRYLPSWLGGAPAEVVLKRSAAFEHACRRLAAGGDFDLVQFEFSQTMPCLDQFSAAGVPVLAVAHDVSFISHQRRAQVARGLRQWFWRREARLMERFEKTWWPRFTRIAAMSTVDAEHIRNAAPGAAVDLVPNGVDTAHIRPVEEGDAPVLIFVGWMRHLPNPDGLTWFLDHVWPRLRRTHPQLRFQVVGRAMPRALERRLAADDSIEYLGYVEDVHAQVGRAWLSVVPLRIGSGTRLKILESMAVATPVVTTSIGSEGIPVNDGVNVRLADTAAEFARAVDELLADVSARRAIAHAAREFVESRYDWCAIGERAAQSIECAMQHQRGTADP